MKQNLFLALFLILSIKAFSQDYKFSLEANYPIPVDDNFVGKDFYGLIDLGVKYRFLDLSLVKLGAGLNGGVLINNANQNELPLDFLVTTYTIQPKAFAELTLESIARLRPFLGLGYSVMIFQYSGTINGEDISDESEDFGGLSVNVGLAFDVTKKFFVQAQVDYTKLNVDDVPDIAYNTNVSLLKVGIGLRF